MSEFLQQLGVTEHSAGAVILAGGLARRMGGRDKGLLQIAGKPMASWVLAAITPQLHKVVLNANRNQRDYAKLGVPVVADTIEGHHGPLAGLSAGISALQCEYIFMCPCDSPFVDGELVNALGMACLKQRVDIAVAHDGTRMQPVFCMVRQHTLDSLNTYLASGQRKIDKWYATQSMTEVDCQHYQNSFRNINTEDDRNTAEAELLA